MDNNDCYARRQQDEMFCATCGLRWDANDENTPCLLPGSAAAKLAGCRCTGSTRVFGGCAIHRKSF